jgi:hypothetical protein
MAFGARAHAAAACNLRAAVVSNYDDLGIVILRSGYFEFTARAILNSL